MERGFPFFSSWENYSQQVYSIKPSHHILHTVMTYKLHANFATVKSSQALSWKEKDGLLVMKQYPQDLMVETDFDDFLSI